MLTVAAILLAALSARPHPRLEPVGDPVGSWRVIKTDAAPFTVRILGYGTETILVGPPDAKVPAPRLVEIRRVDAEPEWIFNPRYVDVPQFQYAAIELTYYKQTELVGTVYVAEGFPSDEIGDVHAGEVRRELQRRFDSKTLWNQSVAFRPVLNTVGVIEGETNVVELGGVNRVEYRVLVRNGDAPWRESGKGLIE